MEQSLTEIPSSLLLGVHSDLKGNTVTSTSQGSKPRQNDSNFTPDDYHSSQRPDKIKEIHKRISAVEQAHAELHAKFQKVIESLTKQIAKKDEANALLEAQINSVKAELQESQKDLGIIVNYIAKHKAKAKQVKTRKFAFNSTKASAKIDKSTSGNKAEVNLSLKDLRTDRRRSPRYQLLKNTFKN